MGRTSGGLASSGGGLYGSGFLGDVTLNGSSFALGGLPNSLFGSISSSPPVYGTNQDVSFRNLTIQSGAGLVLAGDVLYVAGTLTLNGTIYAQNEASLNFPAHGVNKATGGLAGGATTATGFNGLGGATGGTGAGAVPTVTVANGGSGGAGGTGSGGAGGASVKSSLAANAGFPDLVEANGTMWAGTKVLGNLLYSYAGTGDSTVTQPQGGVGGSAGGGDGTNHGGGGGAGSAPAIIFARNIVGTGSIRAVGSAGGTPTTGNCGGGGGGGGGVILIVSPSVVLSTTANAVGPSDGVTIANSAGVNQNVAATVPGITLVVTGGAAGSGVGTGTAGTAGQPGYVIGIPG